MNLYQMLATGLFSSMKSTECDTSEKESQDSLLLDTEITMNTDPSLPKAYQFIGLLSQLVPR